MNAGTICGCETRQPLENVRHWNNLMPWPRQNVLRCFVLLPHPHLQHQLPHFYKLQSDDLLNKLVWHGTDRSPSAMNDPTRTTAAIAGIESWDTPRTNGETTEWVVSEVVVIADVACVTGETTFPPVVVETLASNDTQHWVMGEQPDPRPQCATSTRS